MHANIGHASCSIDRHLQPGNKAQSATVLGANTGRARCSQVDDAWPYPALEKVSCCLKSYLYTFPAQWISCNLTFSLHHSPLHVVICIPPSYHVAAIHLVPRCSLPSNQNCYVSLSAHRAGILSGSGNASCLPWGHAICKSTGQQMASPFLRQC